MRKVDVKVARLDPGTVFRTPEEVLEHPDLTTEQKVDLLQRWEYDERQLDVAEEEGMAGTSCSILDRVLLALGSLGVKPGPGCAAPTKQGGV
jgi:hypothetical protein